MNNAQVSFVLTGLLNGFAKGFGGKPNGMPDNVIEALKNKPIELQIDLENVGARVTTSGFAMFTVNFKPANNLPAFSGNIPAADFIHCVNNSGKAHFQAKSWQTENGETRWSLFNNDAPGTISPADIQAAIELFSEVAVTA